MTCDLSVPGQTNVIAQDTGHSPTIYMCPLPLFCGKRYVATTAQTYATSVRPDRIWLTAEVMGKGDVVCADATQGRGVLRREEDQ